MGNWLLLSEQLKRFDSFYFYEECSIREVALELNRCFPGVEFLYSLKANSFEPVVRCVLAQGWGADAASRAEVLMAHALGVTREKLHYSTPGKTESDIAATLDLATLVADSPQEMEMIESVAQARGRRVKIGVRLNPDFTLDGEGGLPSKFGIDEEQALALLPKWKRLAHLEIAGIHVHLKSQVREAVVLARYYERMLRLACRLEQELGHKLAFLNLGAGLGIPYAPEDSPLDTPTLGRRTSELLKLFRPGLPGTRIIVEAGRYAVCRAGTYVMKVLDRKVSHGRIFVFLCNTLNGFLRPSLARLVMHCAGTADPAGCEPLFTQQNAFGFIALTPETRLERVTLVGNLCTAADVIAEDILLPVLKRGDGLAVTNAGSYAAVLSPMQFASQKPPAELFHTLDGRICAAAGPVRA